MLKNTALAAALALAPGLAFAAGEGGHIEDIAFSFEGPFGTYDTQQLQRGLQVYTEVCAGCHGLRYVPIRALTEEGGPELPEDQVRAYAGQLFVADERANPKLYKEQDDAYSVGFNDNFPANTSAGAPDLSMMAKARAGFHGPYGLGLNQLFRGMGGPEYIVALLNGYEEPPECAPADFPGSYNTVFAPGGYPDECKIYEERTVEKTAEDGTVTTVTERVEVGRSVPGSWIAMGQPLYGDDVVYADGHPTTLHHEAEDVAAFLMWAAEPKLNARKDVGFTAVIFLIIFSVLLYLTNKALWAPIKRKAKGGAAE